MADDTAPDSDATTTPIGVRVGLEGLRLDEPPGGGPGSARGDYEDARRAERPPDAMLTVASGLEVDSTPLSDRLRR